MWVPTKPLFFSSKKWFNSVLIRNWILKLVGLRWRDNDFHSVDFIVCTKHYHHIIFFKYETIWRLLWCQMCECAHSLFCHSGNFLLWYMNKYLIMFFFEPQILLIQKWCTWIPWWAKILQKSIAIDVKATAWHISMLNAEYHIDQYYRPDLHSMRIHWF